MQISQVMTSYTQPDFVEIMMKRDISANFYQKCLTLCNDSTKCALQYELSSSVTMATYWVPDLPILKAFLASFAVPF